MPTSICERALLKPPLNSISITDTHSEDFGLPNARRILDKYQSEIPCFNDDIQGTGCVTLAAMLAALHVSDVKIDDVRVVVFGSGTAGTGIADQIADTIVTQTNKSKQEASKQIW
jgi:malate dehydrogenase (oxaloacetate-decarboxylating)